MATAMLDRALSRVPADVRSYLRLAGLLSASGCALSDEETGAPAKASTERRAPARAETVSRRLQTQLRIQNHQTLPHPHDEPGGACWRLPTPHHEMAMLRLESH